MGSIHTSEYYSAMKKGYSSDACFCMNLESIMKEARPKRPDVLWSPRCAASLRSKNQKDTQPTSGCQGQGREEIA
jgi:hypothetical protein